MSVRAYNIMTFEHERNPVFNLWHDVELVSLLAPYFPTGFDALCGGYLEFSREQLEEARKDAEGEDAKEILDEMIENAIEDEDGYVRYWCF